MEQTLTILYKLISNKRFYHHQYSVQDAIDILKKNREFIDNINII